MSQKVLHALIMPPSFCRSPLLLPLTDSVSYTHQVTETTSTPATCLPVPVSKKNTFSPEVSTLISLYRENMAPDLFPLFESTLSWEKACELFNNAVEDFVLFVAKKEGRELRERRVRFLVGTPNEWNKSLTYYLSSFYYVATTNVPPVVYKEIYKEALWHKWNWLEIAAICNNWRHWVRQPCQQKCRSIIP